MLFPTPAERALRGLATNAALADVLGSPPVLAHFQNVLNELAKTATGSANRIARMCLLSEPPTIDKGEITDKGSINQRSVLTHRAETVAALHEERLHFILKPTP
jgi:feruloyl-CoA synthase